MEKGSYHAIIEELDMGPTDYTVKAACPTEFEFEGTSKGFEGGIAVRDLNNQLVVQASARETIVRRKTRRTGETDVSWP